MINIKLIRRLRRERDLTCKDMAEILGYKSPNGYWLAEKGRVKFQSEHLKMISDLFGISMDDLFINSK